MNKFFKMFTLTTLGLWMSKKIFDLGADIGIAYITYSLILDLKDHDSLIKKFRQSDCKRTRRIGKILTVINK